ncbi:uncharacterized protein [Miscanthus floridulus]|uniref:uncharacterized protein n=1 Tax=Miscanthus floridulus TaxID=154761 RepID=UPI00345B36E5
MEKGLIRTLNDNNIPTRQMVSILSYLRGGLTALPMKKKDISNYRTKLNIELKGSDMTKVLKYFRKRQSEDASFFYKLDLDDDKRLVFKNTRHRNCLFHIKTKCYNKNGKVFAANNGLYEDFEDIVNNSLTVEEFERMWQKMIEDNKLQRNKYLTKMWEMRHSIMSFLKEYDCIIETINRAEKLEDTYNNQKRPKEFIFGYRIE